MRRRPPGRGRWPPAPGRAAGGHRGGRRRARDGVRQPGQRRAHAASSRAGPGVGGAQRGSSTAGGPHGLGVARVARTDLRARGNLKRAKTRSTRAGCQVPFISCRETTGGVFDTLAQIHLIRGQHDEASRCLQKARKPTGDGREPLVSMVVRALEARVALRRGDAASASPFPVK